MTYLSELIGKAVSDRFGNKIGIFEDLIISPQVGSSQPVILAFVIKRIQNTSILSITNIHILDGSEISLSCSTEMANPYRVQISDLWLSKEILDKQAFSLADGHIGRINDLEICQVNDTFQISQVLIGTKGLLLRLGWLELLEKLFTRLHFILPDDAVSWQDVILINDHLSNHALNQLEALHPTNLAKLLTGINRDIAAQIMKNLRIDPIARAIERMRSDIQIALFLELSTDKRVQVLEHMNSARAADLLENLPAEIMEYLLPFIKGRAAREIPKAIAFPKNSVGRVMARNYISLHSEIPVEQAKHYLCRIVQDTQLTQDIYIVNRQNQLDGMISIVDLIAADPSQKIANLTKRAIISARTKDRQDQIIRQMERYGLADMPVVDENGSLMGVIALESLLSKPIAPGWKIFFPHSGH